MAFKPIDPKRDEYRRYLEHSGVIESLTKVLVRILKERPEDPVDYLVHNMGCSRLQADNVAYLQSELKEAHQEIARLKNIIRNINPELLNKSTAQEVHEELVNTTSDDCVESVEVKVETSQEPIKGIEISAISQHQTNADVYVDDNIDNGVQHTHVNSNEDCINDAE